MGQQLLDKLLPALDRISWPENPLANEVGRIAYEQGLEQVDEWRDSPSKLAAALRVFASADSRPYALAGTAYALVAASREQDGSYAPAGLEAAMQWLEEAQELAPDLPDVNFIEGLVYIHEGRPDDARLVLDYLHEQNADSYYLAVTEVAFWEAQENEEQILKWIDQAINVADSVPQRLRLHGRLAGVLRRFGRYEEAREAYLRARHFDAQNLDLLHEMSMLAWEMGDLDESERLNKQVIARSPDHAAAAALDEAIKQKRRDEGGMFGRIFGR